MVYIQTNDGTRMSDVEVDAVWRAVIDGRGNHGSFLKAFGEAYFRADLENRTILLDAAMLLIDKYNLQRYAQKDSE